MSRAHNNTSLLIQRSIPIDSNTTFLAHYDVSANDVNGIHPYEMPIDDNTIMYYKVGDVTAHTSGTYVLDKSMYNNWGVVDGATVTTGRDGNAIQFTDIGQRIATTLPREPIVDLSLEIWMYPTSLPTEDRGILISQNAGFYLTLDSALHISTYWYGKNPMGYHVSTGTITLNTWNHIVVTWSQDTHNIYINGELDKTLSVTGVGTLSANKVCIGNENGGRQFLGKVDHAAILNRVLSAEEVRQRYNSAVYSLSEDGMYGGSIIIQGGQLMYPKELINLNSFTISAWVKTIIDSPITQPILEVNSNDVLNTGGLLIGHEATTHTLCVWSGNTLGQNEDIISSIIPPIDEWYMISVTYDGNALRLYYNGVIAAGGITAIEFKDDATLNVGGKYHGTLDGHIDELRIDSVVRTDEEILDWYISNNPFYPKGNERTVY